MIVWGLRPRLILLPPRPSDVMTNPRRPDRRTLRGATCFGAEVVDIWLLKAGARLEEEEEVTRGGIAAPNNGGPPRSVLHHKQVTLVLTHTQESVKIDRLFAPTTEGPW